MNLTPETLRNFDETVMASPNLSLREMRTLLPSIPRRPPSMKRVLRTAKWKLKLGRLLRKKFGASATPPGSRYFVSHRVEALLKRQLQSESPR